MKVDIDTQETLQWLAVIACLMLIGHCSNENDRIRIAKEQAELDAYLKAGFHPEYHWYGVRWVKP